MQLSLNPTLSVIRFVSVASLAIASFLSFSYDRSHITVSNEDCKKALYIHFPKTGGSSIALTMHGPLRDFSLPAPKEFFNWHHMPAESQRNFYGGSVYANAYSFATVRNPYAFFVSFFFMIDACASMFFVPTGELGDFCELFLNRWPNSSNSTQYHQEIKEMFTQWLVMEDAKANSTKSRFLSGFFITERLPKNKVVSQRAWLTDAKDVKIIVDHVVRIEDHAYKQHTSAAGLKALLCAKAFDEDAHQNDERRFDPAVSTKATNMFLFMNSEAGSSHPSAKMKAKLEENIRKLPLIQKHLDPFYYYSEATCSIVARRFSPDFKAFGYSKSECFQHVLGYGMM